MTFSIPIIGSTNTVSSSLPSSIHHHHSKPFNSTTSSTTTTTTSTTTTKPTTTISSSSTISSTTIPISSPSLDKLILHLKEYQQDHLAKDFSIELNNLQIRLEKSIQKLQNEFKIHKKLKSEFLHYWMIDNTQESRELLISKICSYTFNSIDTIFNSIFLYDEIIDLDLFKSLSCLNEINNIIEYLDCKNIHQICIRDDEYLFLNYLNHTNCINGNGCNNNTQTNNELMRALCLFRKFLNYSILNGLIILYTSIKLSNLNK